MRPHRPHQERIVCACVCVCVCVCVWTDRHRQKERSKCGNRWGCSHCRQTAVRHIHSRHGKSTHHNTDTTTHSPAQNRMTQPCATPHNRSNTHQCIIAQCSIAQHHIYPKETGYTLSLISIHSKPNEQLGRTAAGIFFSLGYMYNTVCLSTHKNRN